MRPVTDAFLGAVRKDHRVAVRVDVLRDDSILATLNTVTGGSVTLDAGAAVRGRTDLTIVDDGTLGLVPSSPSDLLAPYGNELRVHRGILYPGRREPELVSLGIFRIDNTNVDETGAGLAITLAGLDRFARFSDARFEGPYQVAAGTNVATAILDTLTPAYPDVETNFAATTVTTPQLIAEEGGDRGQFALDLAKSAGMRLYFNGDGVLVLAPEILTGSPVTTLVEGAGGVLVKAARKWNRDGVFNRVIATGENTGDTTPSRGVATDDNPLSPTYYHGPFGRVPRFYSSPLITTSAQAADAAEAILARELGTTQRVDFGTIVNPALEPGDVARITRARIRIDEDHILDQLTIPLAAGEAMSGTTRATVVAA